MNAMTWFVVCAFLAGGLWGMVAIKVVERFREEGYGRYSSAAFGLFWPWVAIGALIVTGWYLAFPKRKTQ